MTGIEEGMDNGGILRVTRQDQGFVATMWWGENDGYGQGEAELSLYDALLSLDGELRRASNY